MMGRAHEWLHRGFVHSRDYAGRRREKLRVIDSHSSLPIVVSSRNGMQAQMAAVDSGKGI